MKILILTDRLGTGGAETHIASLALWLRDHHQEVIVLSAGGSTSDRLESLGIPQVRRQISARNPIKLLLFRHRLRKWIRAEHFDVLHAHARLPALLIRGMRRYGMAEIVTVHARFKNGFFLRHLCNWGERSIAVSEDLRTYLHQSYHVPTERITVIPNGIDLSLFSPRKEDAKVRGNHILFASRLDCDCSLGAELLCSVAPSLAQRHPELRITIAGGGSEKEHIATLAEKINQSLGFCCITVCGECNNMAELMRGCDIFVGVSRAALEAIACGCSVILCGNEGYLGILDGTGFSYAALSNFCCRGEPSATAERLERDLDLLLQDQSRRYRNALECRALLVALHDAKVTCAQTMALYRREKHEPITRTLTVGGYFGCGNLGDDAILQAFLLQLRKIAPDVRVLALSGEPRRNSRRFGISCYGRMNPVAVLYAVARSSIRLCGGGSLLQNSTGNRSLCYYRTLLHLFSHIGGCAVLYSAGIGPLYGKPAATRTYRALERCTYISLRDPDSMCLLGEAGIDRARLHLGADPALLLPPPPLSRTDAVLHTLSIPPAKKYMCAVLRVGKHADHACSIAVAATRMLCKKHGWHPVLICLSREDRALHATVARRLGADILFPTEPSDVSAILRRCELLISMRLHALILAATVSAPAVGLPVANDPKITSFTQQCAQKAVPEEALSVGALVEACEKMHRSATRLRPVWASAVADLQKKAQKDLENIVMMVYNINRYDKKSEDMT